MSVYFHDTDLSSTKGSSCYRWYINVYIDGCAEANGFNFLEILNIDCFIRRLRYLYQCGNINIDLA